MLSFGFGGELPTCETKGFLGSVAMVKYNDKWGFATKQGTFLGSKQFSKINIFVEIKKK